MRYFLSEEILNAIEAIGFSVQQNVNYIFLQIFSPAGQDCNLIFDKDECRDFDAFADEIYDRYEDFDVSSEAMFWLDSEGHGKNGAPYEMKAVLEDMEWLENKLFELYRAVKGVIANV